MVLSINPYRESWFILKNKVAVREYFRHQLTTLSPSYSHTAALRAATLFSESAIFKSQQHFAIYLPIKQEFLTQPLIEKIWQAEKYCYLPILEKGSKHLTFVRYEPNDELIINQFAISEPKARQEIILPDQLDVVLTPLVAFDKQGTRLGTGGGYYDQTFEFTKKSTLPQPLLIGLGYAIQEATHLPNDPWDIKLAGILTEQEFSLF